MSVDHPKPLLDGIRVVEVATMVFAPAACVVLADYGADVIKIEPPGSGDLNRHYHKLPGMPESDDPYTFQIDNRNKRSVAINLKSDEGYDAFRRLIHDADIFVSNYRPAALKRLRLRYEDVQPYNPRLIYALGTGYGERGEEQNRPGYDSVCYWARSGIESHLYPLEGYLGPFPFGSGDHPSGTALFGAIMLGLYRRQLTGEGCKVSTSLLANGVWANSTMLQAHLSGAKFSERRPRQQAYNFGHTHYKTSDGRFMKISMVNSAKDWAPFCQAIGRTDIIDDPRFAELDNRVANMEQLIQIIDDALLQHDVDHWRRIFDQYDITHAVLANCAEVATDPQMHANQIVVPMDHPQLGTIATVSSPMQIDGVPKSKPTAAPKLGQHTRDVLRDVGYSDQEIDEFIEEGTAEE